MGQSVALTARKSNPDSLRLQQSPVLPTEDLMPAHEYPSQTQRLGLDMDNASAAPAASLACRSARALPLFMISHMLDVRVRDEQDCGDDLDQRTWRVSS
ncbi:MAG: hypothetical protein K2Q97_01840 [Burkholderiaceae bacterium]|nr:hypothetical protein [Burkholderiaceae bacterium]